MSTVTLLQNNSAGLFTYSICLFFLRKPQNYMTEVYTSADISFFLSVSVDADTRTLCSSHFILPCPYTSTQHLLLRTNNTFYSVPNDVFQIILFFIKKINFLFSYLYLQIHYFWSMRYLRLISTLIVPIFLRGIVDLYFACSYKIILYLHL
jgi:hypothetical protein